MALRYDPPTEGFTQSIPVGIRAFRKTAPAAFGFPWTEVVRNLDRCQPATKSEHCVCRGEDNFVNKEHDLVPVALGRAFFEWCVKHADALGIQAVIFNRRVWGFGNWTERHYSGDSPHTDHVHIGFNKWAAANLTVEMVRAALDGQGDTGVSKQDVIDALNEYGKATDGSTWASRLDADTDQLKPILSLISGIANGTIQVTCKGGSGGAGITEAQIEAACARALVKIKVTVA